MPRFRVSRGYISLLSLLVSLAVAGGPALAEVQIKIPPPATAELDDLFTRGRKLESERRWGEALLLYEDGAKQHPGQLALEERLDLTRIHYDLARRYADPSFRHAALALPRDDALDLFSEVLTKIQAHYVHTPRWRSLVDRGTLDIEVALGESLFLEHNLPRVSAEQTDAFRREVRSALARQSVSTPREARESVALAARIAEKHLGLNPAVTVLEYTCGAAGALDEYSTFLTGDQLSDLYSQIEGNFVGLGVELKASDKALLIVSVIRGSPAERSGIKSGDRLTAVAGRSTAELSTDEAAELLQGDEGTTVEVVAVTGDEPPRKLTVRRENVDVPSVDDVRMIDPDLGVGYFKLTCFQKTTSRDLDAALWKLHRQGLRSLVIDLRGNPGGLLSASVDAADRFLEQGAIVSTRGRNPQEDYNYSAHRTGTWRLPLVVLIDGDSASASEIFAGAIRDHRRGTIVGTRSYGKGSVQGIFPLTIAGAGLRLTTAKFYSPQGRPYSRVGVEPEIVVHQAAKPIDGQIAAVSVADAPADPTLAAGLAAARRQVGQQ